MTKTAFFVQNNYVERLTVPVARYAHEHGVALEDRSSANGFDPDNCGVDWSQYELVLPYGSVQFLRRLKESSLRRFILHDEERFATATWSPLFGSDTLNGSGRCVAAGDVAAVLRSATAAQHVRPDRVDKAFAGAVFDVATWETIREERKLQADLACWVSPVQVIEAEWRCWIIGGICREVSQYRAGGERSFVREARSEVWESAQRLADRYLPSPCVVLDVALVGGQYKLIEFNPIHCAGWYAADVPAVLGAWRDWMEGQRTA